MRLTVVRSGGLAGMRRTWSAQLSSEEAEQQWLPLFRHPPGEAADAGADRFTYEISVGPAAVTIPEARLTGPWRELVERARAGDGGRPGEGGSRG